MKNILSVASWEYRTRIRSKWFIFSTILMPIIIVASMFIPALVMSGPDSDVRIIAVVDGTQKIGKLFQAELTDRYRLKNGQLKYQVIELSGVNTGQYLKTAAALLDSNVISAYLEIPENVMDSNQVRYYSRNLGNFKDMGELSQTINDVIVRERMVAARLDYDLINHLSKQVGFRTLEVKKGGETREGSEMIAYLMPIIYVLMLFFAIFMSSQILLRSVLAERTNRLVEILISSVTPRELMTGKILGLGLLGLSQLALYLIVGYFASQARGMLIFSSENILFFLIYFVLGYLLYASLFAAIGAIFNSEQEAQSAVSIFSLISILPIMISSYVIANPNSTTSLILSFVPPMTPFFMILRIGVETPPLWQILATTVWLAFSVWLAMLAAGKIFKVALLIYGKRPTFPQIWQWIRA